MNLKERILQIAGDNKLSHVGSCMSCLPVLEDIYKEKQPQDKVMLDNGHAHLAHLVVKEAYEGLQDIEQLLNTHGIHCDRKAGCDVSTGSLGHLGIGVGLAISNRERNVYVVVSDGSMFEGANWEALETAHRLRLDNLKIRCNFNGWSGYEQVDVDRLELKLSLYDVDTIIYRTSNHPMREDLSAHYETI